MRLLYNWENYFIVIGWGHANLSLAVNQLSHSFPLSLNRIYKISMSVSTIFTHKFTQSCMFYNLAAIKARVRSTKKNIRKHYLSEVYKGVWEKGWSSYRSFPCLVAATSSIFDAKASATAMTSHRHPTGQTAGPRHLRVVTKLTARSLGRKGKTSCTGIRDN